MATRLRTNELALLPFPILLLTGATLLLHYARGSQWDSVDLAAGLLFAAVLLVLHVVLTWRLPRADQALLPIVAALCAFGLIAVSRLAPELTSRQSLWILVGVVALL